MQQLTPAALAKNGAVRRGSVWAGGYYIEKARSISRLYRGVNRVAGRGERHKNGLPLIRRRAITHRAQMGDAECYGLAGGVLRQAEAAFTAGASRPPMVGTGTPVVVGKLFGKPFICRTARKAKASASK